MRQIGAIGQDGGEKSVLVIAGLTGPDVGECGGKTCRTVDLMQQLGDPYAWHHCVEPIGQGFRFGRGDGLQRRDVHVNAHRNGTLDVRRKGTPLKGLEGLSHDTRNWIPCLTKNGALLS